MKCAARTTGPRANPGSSSVCCCPPRGASGYRRRSSARRWVRPLDEGAAESLVRERGLSSLADRWWVRVGGGSWREAWLLEVKPDRLRLRWDDPMLMQAGHGEWVRLDEAEIQRHRPAR